MAQAICFQREEVQNYFVPREDFGKIQQVCISFYLQTTRVSGQTQSSANCGARTATATVPFLIQDQRTLEPPTV